MIDPNLCCWIWLQTALYQGSEKIPLIHERYKSAEQFYNLGFDGWRKSGIFSPKELSRLRDISPKAAYEIIDVSSRLGYDILTPDMEEYPKRLLNIPDYPAALYVWGRLENIDDMVAIAVVGTRTSTPYGEKIAATLCYSLAKAGVIIVSGGANGIDSCATNGALYANGKSIIVLGCGINTNYLSHNADMRKACAENGAVISEYPPGTPAYGRNFPVRNRIMSGISLGTVVIEAPMKSGALITAKAAANQGRDVFAVPGSVLSEYSKGCNRLINDGAKAVNSPIDILEEYIGQYPHRITIDYDNVKKSIIPQDENIDNDKRLKNYFINKPVHMAKAAQPEPEIKTKTMKDDIDQHLSEDEKIIYSLLNKKPVHIDYLSEKSGLAPSRVSAAITGLEIKSMIKQHPGRHFSL